MSDKLVKVGDLVRKKYKPGLATEGLVGIVLHVNTWTRVDGTTDTPSVRVKWPGDYGIFWTTSDSLEIVSEA